ncbi:RTA1-domain-containing protein [Athelia psychrophila]|uniref:RTA1-domain-containing protein n=1 Tax=Athelia psychrophila TaxID=1759441 RepID=A0A166WA52_9AGAM|nr:RTA1-domain-containing protein [Fibularhizoctonia sp. CBS 109695]
MSYTFSNGTTLTPQEVWDDSSYHYIPTKYVCIIFVTLFGISSLIHLAQGIYYRMWWLFPTAILAGAAETLGWSARLWSSLNFLLDTPFMIQISVTIIAPTPLVAANFIILGRIVRKLGSRYSRLSPKWYTIVFCGFDIASLVVQALGGGIASGASTQSGTKLGANIMLGGIATQMVFITVYAALAAEFIWRFFNDRPVRGDATSRQPEEPRVVMDKQLKTMIIALAFNTFCLYVRAVYRVIELSDGWNGKVISTQNYFNVFDGAMVVLAIYTLNFFHPGRLLSAPAEYASGEKPNLVSKYSTASSSSAANVV